MSELQYRVVTFIGSAWFVVAIPRSYGDLDVRAVPWLDLAHVAGPFTTRRQAEAVRNEASRKAWVDERPANPTNLMDNAGQTCGRASS